MKRAEYMKRIADAVRPGDRTEADNEKRLTALCGVAGAVFAASYIKGYESHPTMPEDLANAALKGMNDYLDSWNQRN